MSPAGAQRRPVLVYPDYEALSRGAARLLVETAQRAARERGRCLLLLSGGETPRRLYQLLAEEPLRSQVPWHALQLFWGDERWVPQDDPENNAGAARRLLLDRVPLEESQIHPVPFGPSPRDAALDYDRLLHGFLEPAAPGPDLVLLGLGEEGHTASLFPGSPLLQEGSRWVGETFVPEKGGYRISATPALINRAALVLFMVAGSSKAAILRRVLVDTGSPEPLPAQLIAPAAGGVLWLADARAARELPEAVLVREEASPKTLERRADPT